MKRLALALALLLPACASSAPPKAKTEQALDDVARVHGAPGPWAVAGYRMGEYALAKLGLSRGSFDLEVIHRSPREVQYSCIADGASAATGASVGKLNLSLAEATREDLVTVYRDKKSGRSLALRPTASFRAKFLDRDTSDPQTVREMGREIMAMPDSAIFEEVPPP